jgi:hypothetical protein
VKEGERGWERGRAATREGSREMAALAHNYPQTNQFFIGLKNDFLFGFRSLIEGSAATDI